MNEIHKAELIDALDEIESSIREIRDSLAASISDITGILTPEQAAEIKRKIAETVRKDRVRKIAIILAD